MVLSGESRKNRGLPRVWPWLAALNVAAFVVQDVTMGDRTLLDRALPTGSAIDDGELWRALTSVVVHPGGLVHLGINTVLLLAAGPRAEGQLDSRRFLATYVAAGFATNALRYAAGGTTGGGASGAIFAIAAAGSAVAWLQSDRRHREGAVWIASVALTGGGLVVAGTVSDAHLLALGLGALCGRAAHGEPGGFRRTMVALTLVGFVAMAVRSAVR